MSISDGTVVQAKDLNRFVSSIFRSAGMPQGYAEAQADILVWANLRGIDSHGVLRVPYYVGLIDKGSMIPDAVPEVVSQMPAVALIDAHRAPGPIGTLAGVDKAIELAETAGAAWVVMRNLTHNGALAYYTKRIAERGFIGMTTVSSPPNMAPFGAKAAGLHNSPISMGIPTSHREPIVLDMATSVAAGGKIYFAADRGASIPEGWALDPEGNSTTDPNKATIWLPFEGPKGSGLAMMFECWSSLLANNPLCSPQIKAGSSAEDDHRQNGMVAAIKVSAFLDRAQFEGLANEFADCIKGLPRSGPNEILVPGEREAAVSVQRSKDGIHLPQGTCDRIAPLATRFGIKPIW